MRVALEAHDDSVAKQFEEHTATQAQEREAANNSTADALQELGASVRGLEEALDEHRAARTADVGKADARAAVTEAATEVSR